MGWLRDLITAGPPKRPDTPEPTATAQHSGGVVTNPRSTGDVSPYRTVNRDRVIEATNAPPGARQVWQLHRAREESRDLELRSPIWGGWVRYNRIQTIGYEPARLVYEMTREDKARLQRVVAWLRRDWSRFHRIRGLGGTGQNLHQLAGSVLHHKQVDGDCFLTRRRLAGRDGVKRNVYDLHPGDALSETTHHIAPGGGRSRQLGVESDEYGAPEVYIFGGGGRRAQYTWGYASYAVGQERRVSARDVIHIRDRSGEVTAVRGWPRCVTVIEDIARLDEWYSALVRSATLRAAIGLALEQDPMFGSPGDLGGDLAPGEIARSTGERELGTGPEAGQGDRLRPYQEFAARGGTIMELLPGYKPHMINTGAPTSQEAQAIGMLEHRVCAGLRTTPATLLGKYSELSFSGGQLMNLQEREAVEDDQMMLGDQFYSHVFYGYLVARWMRLMMMFTELLPDDLALLGGPIFRLRKYQVLDKGRLVKPIMEAWEKGLMTYAEARSELGFIGVNVDDVIAEWKENRRALGLPEVPSEGGGGMVAKDDGDDADKGEKGDDDGAD